MGKRKYWKGLEDLDAQSEVLRKAESEFPEELPVDVFLGDKKSLEASSTTRRDFLKYLGFSVTAASLASCEAPVQKAIPYLFKPEEITPGIANWYASSYFDGHDYCDVLVKTREGRPIKIEGNKLSPLTKGGVNARVHASVLSLYDSERLKGPLANGKEASWEAIDTAVMDKLSSGGNIRILTSTIVSPSTKRVISQFSEKYPNTKHISYDAISYAAIRKANKQTFGKEVIPSYRFNKAKVIVSFGADFLSNWLSPIEFASQYMENRDPGKKRLSKHFQLETNLTVTGSNADKRIAIKPSEQGKAVVNLYNYITALAGAPTKNSAELNCNEQLSSIAKELWSNRGNTLVVSGSNDINIQLVVNEINRLLQSYKSTIDLNKPFLLKQGNDSQVEALISEMAEGNVDALLIHNVNPAYTLPTSLKFTQALKNVRLVISFSDRLDETAALSDIVCPNHHPFESWNDANPVSGHYSITQPVIRPIFNTRAFQQSLLTWSDNKITYYDLIRSYWQETLFPLQTEQVLFDSFWNKCVHDGIFITKSNTDIIPDHEDTGESTSQEDNTASPDLNSAIDAINGVMAPEGFELILYEKTGIGDGRQANNPWLQELPDPISKVCWDNYITMSPGQMKEMGLNTKQGQEEKADLIQVSVNGKNITAPAVAQPGQPYGTIGIALGYGRTSAGKASNNLGVNAYPYVSLNNGTFQYEALGASLSGSMGKYHIAATQTHHTMMGRDLVKETTLSEYIKDPSAGNPAKTISVKEGKQHIQKPVEDLSLWQEYEENGHFWNLSVDLNACIGCGACVVSCNAENNISVVGKDEVRRAREMHWMRIDRYYSSDADEDDLRGMEEPSESPEVVFQPVMCQHCNHASCETVCPVIATSHSTDGLNQMTYNRCVGTRYCANNCPYKVRRFNWFQYDSYDKFSDVNPAQNDLGRMVLNPDVVVRSRGVMEKCSMCVQRIQDGKLTAKKEGRKLKDGEIQTACSQSCPTNAIVFGDINDPESRVSALKKDERKYILLEEVGVRPNVFYLTKVRNKDLQSNKS